MAASCVHKHWRPIFFDFASALNVQPGDNILMASMAGVALPALPILRHTSRQRNKSRMMPMANDHASEQMAIALDVKAIRDCIGDIMSRAKSVSRGDEHDLQEARWELEQLLAAINNAQMYPRLMRLDP